MLAPGVLSLGAHGSCHPPILFCILKIHYIIFMPKERQPVPQKKNHGISHRWCRPPSRQSSRGTVPSAPGVGRRPQVQSPPPSAEGPQALTPLHSQAAHSLHGPSPSGLHRPFLLAWLGTPRPSRQLLMKQGPRRAADTPHSVDTGPAGTGGNHSRALRPALGPAAQQRLAVPSTPLATSLNWCSILCQACGRVDIWVGNPRTHLALTRRQAALQ